MRFFFNLLLMVCLLGIFALTNSCKKDDENTIIVKGIITDANLKTPIANAEVTFWASRIQNATYNSNYISLATTYTDANGNYVLQITKGKDAGFRITAEKAKYFGQTADIVVDALPAGTHTLNYSIYPEAFFKMNVKNNTPINNSDFISYWFYNTQPTGANCCNNLAINFTGQFYENTVKCRTFGGQNIIVKWNVKKNNVVTYNESTIYCTPFDTTTFDLNY